MVRVGEVTRVELLEVGSEVGEPLGVEELLDVCVLVRQNLAFK